MEGKDGYSTRMKSQKDAWLQNKWSKITSSILQDVHVGHGLACSEIAATCNWQQETMTIEFPKSCLLYQNNHGQFRACTNQGWWRSKAATAWRAKWLQREKHGLNWKLVVWVDVLPLPRGLFQVPCLFSVFVYIFFLPKLLATWNEEPLKRHRAFLTAVTFCFTKKTYENQDHETIYISPDLQQHSTRTSLDQNTKAFHQVWTERSR